MPNTITVAKRVLKQILKDKRYLLISLVVPVLIIIALKLFFDSMEDDFPKERYIMPISSFIAHFLGFILCAIVLVQERKGGTLERMFISGYRKVQIILGYIFGYMFIGTIQTVIILTLSINIFDLDYSAGTIFFLFLLIWFLVIASVMLGILVSTFARTEGQVIPFIPLIIIPSIFLSGMLIDRDKLPVAAEVLGYIFPMSYANQVIQELITVDWEFRDIWVYYLILLVYVLVLLFLASRTLKESD